MPRKKRLPELPPEKVAAMAGEATEATLNVLSGEKVKVVVEVDRNEFEDLEEYVRHHQGDVKTPGEALHRMAGLRGYRVMKQMTDPERKKPSMLVQDAGIPSNVPCALMETVKKMGMTYEEFLGFSAKMANKLAKQAAAGDDTAKRALRTLFVKISG